MSSTFFEGVSKKPKVVRAGVSARAQDGASNNRPLNNGDIMELAHFLLTSSKDSCMLRI